MGFLNKPTFIGQNTTPIEPEKSVRQMAWDTVKQIPGALFKNVIYDADKPAGQRMLPQGLWAATQAAAQGEDDIRTGKAPTPVKKSDYPMSKLAMNLAMGATTGDVNELKGGLTMGKNAILNNTAKKQLSNAIEAKASNTLDPKNFKSAEEYVKAQRKMYRGGTEYNPARVNSKSEVFNGVALTESPERAKFYTAGTQGRGGEKGRFVQELFIDNKANIASQEHIPQSLWATMEPEDIARWAKENGYDGVDLRSLGGSIAQADKEIRIFNPDMLQTKSQLTDIWNKANKK
jgi:hypothetical protein